MAGKDDARRPAQVPPDAFAAAWRRTFEQMDPEPAPDVVEVPPDTFAAEFAQVFGRRPDPHERMGVVRHGRWVAVITPAKEPTDG